MCAAVFVRAGEDIEVAIKRFQMQCEKEGVLAEIKKRESFLSPSEARHIKDCKQRHLRKLAKLKREIV